MSKLLEILGCRYPIIQGPIGALNSARMIAAVCEAGAFGMLALGFINDAEEVRRLCVEVQEQTDKPFGANLMMMNRNNPAILEVLAEMGVKTVTTSAGSPRQLYPRIHELGMRGLQVLLSANLARKSAEAGVDGLVASGLESGGLRTNTPESTTMILVPLVVDQVDVPVVAAGGIADRRGFRAALALGAQGVQLGTRFLASEESPASQAWKKAILECGDGGTMRIPQGPMTVRVIINPKLKALADDPQADLSKEYNLANGYKAWSTGDFDLFPAGGGQVSALIKEIKPVKDIIEELVAE